MNQNGNGVNGETTADQFSTSVTLPVTAVIVDDGDAGFAAGAGWAYQPNPSGYPYYQQDHHYRVGSPGGAAATWTAAVPAGTYRVSAHWVGYPNRATNAGYAVRDGAGNTLATKTINQEADPDDFQDLGAWWEDLGTVTISSATNLVVSLSGQANEVLIADAMRFELVGPPPPPPPPGAVTVVDDGDAGFAVGSGWTRQPNSAGYPYYQGDHHYAPGSPGTGAATWTATNLAAGTYRVSAYWVPYPNRATNAGYAVKDGSGATLATKTINQEADPDDFQADGAWWEDLGTVTLTSTGSLVVSLSGQANEVLIADAVRFELM
jgi:hypothetical protein